MKDPGNCADSPCRHEDGSGANWSDTVAKAITTGRCPLWRRGRKACRIQARVDVIVAVDVQLQKNNNLLPMDTVSNVNQAVNDALNRPGSRQQFGWCNVRCVAHSWRAGADE